MVERPPEATAREANKPPVVVQAEPYNPPPPPTYQTQGQTITKLPHFDCNSSFISRFFFISIDPYDREPYRNSYGRERIIVTDRYGRRYLVERDAYYDPPEPTAEEEWMWGCCVCIYCLFIIFLFMLMFGAFGDSGQRFKTACKDMFFGVCGHIAATFKGLGQAMNFHMESVENLLEPRNNLRGILDKNVQQVNSTKH